MQLFLIGFAAIVIIIAATTYVISESKSQKKFWDSLEK